MSDIIANDGLRSFVSGLGHTRRDKVASLVHADVFVSDQQLAAAYRSDWISKKIIDIPADDALRKWRTWPAAHRAEIEREEKRLGLRAKVLRALKHARLYGGAAIYIGLKGQDPAEPIDIDKVGRGDIEYLTVLTRTELTAGPIDRDPFSAYHGRPRSYMVSGSVAQATIHPSRLAIFIGDDRGDSWSARGAHAAWGESVLAATDSIVKQALGTFAATASLVHEANVDVVGIKDLSARVNMPGGEDALLKRFTTAAEAKGITGMLILDADEDYNRRAASFAQLPELMEAFARFCAAAADIPATRFLAQSPSGLIATGESDMDNYHDAVGALQSLEIEPALSNTDACLVRSALGESPEEAVYDWTPLQQMNERELAEIGKMTCESLKMISELGDGAAFTVAEVREIAVHRLAEIKAFPHFTEVLARTEAALSLAPLPDEPGPDDDTPDAA